MIPSRSQMRTTSLVRSASSRNLRSGGTRGRRGRALPPEQVGDADHQRQHGDSAAGHHGRLDQDPPFRAQPIAIAAAIAATDAATRVAAPSPSVQAAPGCSRAGRTRPAATSGAAPSRPNPISWMTCDQGPGRIPLIRAPTASDSPTVTTNSAR